MKNQNEFQPNLTAAKRPFYNLMMFPYPSAEGLHVGNMYAFTGSDIYGRFMKLQGYDLFEPIGLDGFGIHSENYALQKNVHPAEMAKITKDNFYRQLKSIGNAYTWDNTLETYDPDYYKWTQWIFIQMYKKGLAYRKKAAVNWCPSCKTVLADEQVENGKCERCKHQVIQKDLEQWFFRITKYAEKLYQEIDKLDWSEKVKIAQKNWIGRSEGALIKFQLIADSRKLKADVEVFTTRPDTIFGATYLVLAPEHEIISKIKSQISNFKDVEDYIKMARSKSDIERIEEGKEKTGVELKGIKAINPATKKEIPIFIADYVLTTYGTGAIMAVPAHDKRDFEFAKKYKLPIIRVIEPCFVSTTGNDAIHKELPFTERDAILAIVKHWSENKYIGLKWKKVNWQTMITGGPEKNQTPKQGAITEIIEETGYLHPKLIKELNPIHSKFFHGPKNLNRFAHFRVFYFELQDDKHENISQDEQAKHEVAWLSPKEMERFLTPESHIFAWKEFRCDMPVYTNNGIMVNSGKFNGLDSQTAKNEVIKYICAKSTVQYRLRDWLISRQRYWGPPIPMINCPKCGWQPVNEKDLPIKLPETKNWHPKGAGQSPLAGIAEFVNAVCPKCAGKAKRETDVSDTFLDSAWYFYRYLSPKDKDHIFDKKLARKWLPVDMYIGGAEHSVLHLLYVRFITYVFKELGLINFDSPFKKFRAHGLIIKDGAKMSKSRGNVINPDLYIKKYGSDVLRMYLMFIGPFTEGGDFREEGIKGIKRFLDRVSSLSKNYKVKDENIKQSSDNQMVNSTVKKVTEDIENLQFNTAISQMMILLNEITKNPKLFTTSDFQYLLIILSPFAPKISDQLWQKLGHKQSIFTAKWPKVTGKTEKDILIMPVMINGKKRAVLEIESANKINEEQILQLARLNKNCGKYLQGSKIKKIVYVPGKIISIVL